MTVKTVIDASLMGGPHPRGMARFGEALVRHYGEQIVELRPTSQAKVFNLFPLWEQIGLRNLIRSLAPRVAFFPYNTGPLTINQLQTFQVLVVHDLIFLSEGIFSGGTIYQTIGRIYRKAVVPRVIRRAGLIVTVSQYSADRLKQTFDLPDDKVFVLPNTFLDRFGAAPDRRRQSGLIFTVSGEAPSKNLNALIGAFALTINHVPDARLVVAGLSPKGHVAFSQKYRSLIDSKSMELLPRVGDEALEGWYTSCALYVCASIEEGFGIPVLEAMACRAPVAVSDRSSLPEICGNAARYFDPTEPADMARVLIEELQDSAGGRERIINGLERVQVYSRAAFASRCGELRSKVNSMIS